MAKQPDIYEKFSRSIAPSIFGNTGSSRPPFLLPFSINRADTSPGCRHQEVDHLSPDGRLEEGSPRRHASSWRYQRPHAR
jgi:hypothetical protein